MAKPHFKFNVKAMLAIEKLDILSQNWNLLKFTLSESTLI